MHFVHGSPSPGAPLTPSHFLTCQPSSSLSHLLPCSSTTCLPLFLIHSPTHAPTHPFSGSCGSLPLTLLFTHFIFLPRGQWQVREIERQPRHPSKDCILGNCLNHLLEHAGPGANITIDYLGFYLPLKIF